MNCGRNLRRTRKVHSALLCGSGWYISIAKCHDTQIVIDVGYLSEVVCFDEAWCDKKAFDTVIHPIPKCVIFLEDLLQDIVDKKSKDPFGTFRVARKALSKVRY